MLFGQGASPYGTSGRVSGMIIPSSGVRYLIEAMRPFFDFTIAYVLFFVIVISGRNLTNTISLHSFFL